MAEMIDGKKISEKIRSEIAIKVQDLKKQKGLTPGLAVVLVGEDEASQIYVRNKIKACEDVGIKSLHYRLSKDTTPREFLDLMDKLNRDPEVHGILVQLPLPASLQDIDVVMLIHPDKDVDGFHPVNVGKLMTGREGFRSCTPFGIMKMLEDIHYSLKGKNAVIVGRSNIVGKPMGMMFLEKHATVTYCHSRTEDLPQKILSADIVVAAMGKAEFIKGDWIKPGAVVIDVGMNRNQEGKLVGDVEFASAEKRASYITPVPGGVGPMTITMLLWNTLQAACKAAS